VKNDPKSYPEFDAIDQLLASCALDPKDAPKSRQAMLPHIDEALLPVFREELDPRFPPDQWTLPLVSKETLDRLTRVTYQVIAVLTSRGFKVVRNGYKDLAV
jgi:hypothetical protein